MPRPLRVLPEKVVEARESLGWNQAELARKAKLSQPTVSELERGITKEPKFETIQQIATATGRQVAFFTGEGNTATEDTASYRVVPIISWVQAGTKNAVTDPYQPGAADDWEDVTVPTSKTTYALRVRGDSMAPDFPEGTIIIVDPELAAKNGDFVVVRFENSDEATFKRLVVDGPFKLLRPINSSYPTIQVTEDARLCGVVVESNMRRRFR